MNLLLEANASPQAKQKRVGHFPRKMDLIMNFREKLKKISPHHPQKKHQKKQNQKKQTNTKQKHKKKNKRKTTLDKAS